MDRCFVRILIHAQTSRGNGHARENRPPRTCLWYPQHSNVNFRIKRRLSNAAPNLSGLDSEENAGSQGSACGAQPWAVGRYRRGAIVFGLAREFLSGVNGRNGKDGFAPVSGDYPQRGMRYSLHARFCACKTGCKKTSMAVGGVALPVSVCRMSPPLQGQQAQPAENQNHARRLGDHFADDHVVNIQDLSDGAGSAPWEEIELERGGRVSCYCPSAVGCGIGVSSPSTATVSNKVGSAAAVAILCQQAKISS